MRCQPGSGSGSTSETPWTTATASATSPENKSGPSSAELTPLATDVIQRFDAGGRAICGGTPAARGLAIPIGAWRLCQSGDQPWQAAPSGLRIEVDEPRRHAPALRIVGEPGRCWASYQATSKHTFVDLAEHERVAHEAAAALGDLARDVGVPTPGQGDDRGVRGRPGVDRDIAVAKISNSSIESSRHGAIPLEPRGDHD